MQADEIAVCGPEHTETPTRDVDDPCRRVTVRDVGRADLGERAVGDLAQWDRTGRYERSVRLLDLFDLPEDERVVDPRRRGQANLCAGAREYGEVLPHECRLLPEHRGPGVDARREVPGREDHILEAEQLTHQAR